MPRETIASIATMVNADSSMIDKWDRPRRHITPCQQDP
jgi:hypothetical protein